MCAAAREDFPGLPQLGAAVRVRHQRHAGEERGSAEGCGYATCYTVRGNLPYTTAYGGGSTWRQGREAEGFNQYMKQWVQTEINNLSEECVEALSGKGMTRSGLIATSRSTSFYDGNQLYCRGRNLESFGVDPELTSYRYAATRLPDFFAEPSNAAFSGFTGQSSIVVGGVFFAPRVVGATVHSVNQGAQLVHELLHVNTSKGDIALASLLGLGTFTNADDASKRITAWLTGNCK